MKTKTGLIILGIILFILIVIGNAIIEDKEMQIQQMKENIRKNQTINFNPTYEEVERIVRQTNIEENEFTGMDYNCVEFSYDLVNEFLDNGIYACITELVFEDDTAHANVVLNTSDRGIIFIEPQTDKIIGEKELKKGNNYCEKMDFCFGELYLTEVKTCFGGLE